MGSGIRRQYVMGNKYLKGGNRVNSGYRPSVLQPTSVSKLLHCPLLVFREFLGHLHIYLHDQVSLLSVLFDALPADAEALAVGSAGRNADRDLLAVERAHANA